MVLQFLGVGQRTAAAVGKEGAMAEPARLVATTMRRPRRAFQQALERSQRQAGSRRTIRFRRRAQSGQTHHVRAGGVSVEHLQQEGPHRSGGPQLPFAPRVAGLTTSLPDRLGGEKLRDVALDSRDGLHNTARHGRTSGWGDCDHTKHSGRRSDRFTLQEQPHRSLASPT